MNAGAAIVMLEPDTDHGLQPVLDLFGISHNRQMVNDTRQHYQSDPTTPAVSDYTRHAITRNVPVSIFPGVSSFTPAADGLQESTLVTPLVISSPGSFLGTDRQQLDRRTLMLHAPVAAGGKHASLVLAGDADFATNQHYPLLGNAALFLNTVNYLTQRESLIDIQPRHYHTQGVQLTNRQMQFSFFISSILLPALAILLGVFLWWRRR